MHRRPTRTSHRLTAALAALVAMLAVASPAGAATSGSDSVGFGVSPLRFDVETKAGSTSTHNITITNSDTSATTFTFTREDFEGDRKDPAATPVLLGGKLASDISGYDWIDPPGKVTVPAGQSRVVPVKVSVPAGASGAHYAALIVAGEARTAGEVVAQSRLAVLFLMNAGGAPPPEIVITEIREVGPGRIVTEFINKGKGPTDDTGGTLTRDPLRPGVDDEVIDGTCTKHVMPGAAGRCTFDRNAGGNGSGTSDDDGFLPAGPAEEYIDIVGDPGEEGTSARGELPTEWAGTWSSLLLPLVGVALFVLYFLFLRRRRKDGEDELPYSSFS